LQKAEPFTKEQLETLWNTFAEQRKQFQLDYQLLSQPFNLKDNQIIILLTNPIQETALNGIRNELTAFLREGLQNNSISISSELKTEENKKVIYTNREKFEYLAEKNPMLLELRERLGLDMDF
jgi:DNA polymerase-3 subunit gamma/tau